MKQPEMIQQIAQIESDRQVYIEDYVYTYLNELKMQKEDDTAKVALFGYIRSRDSQKIRFIYGAACLTKASEKVCDEEQIREAYFPEYEFLGYVKLSPKQSEVSRQGKNYCIFYDSNEAMQNYMLSCYRRDAESSLSAEEREELAAVWQRSKRRFTLAGNIIRKILYVIGVLLLAVAVTTINDHEKMQGFVQTAQRAVFISSNY